MKKFFLIFNIGLILLVINGCINPNSVDSLLEIIPNWSLVGDTSAFSDNSTIATGSSLKVLTLKSTLTSTEALNVTPGTFDSNNVLIIDNPLASLSSNTVINLLEVPSNMTALINSLNDSDYYTFIVLDDINSNNQADLGERIALAIPLDKSYYSSNSVPETINEVIFKTGSQLKSNSFILVLSQMQIIN